MEPAKGYESGAQVVLAYIGYHSAFLSRSMDTPLAHEFCNAYNRYTMGAPKGAHTKVTNWRLQFGATPLSGPG